MAYVYMVTVDNPLLRITTSKEDLLVVSSLVLYLENSSAKAYVYIVMKQCRVRYTSLALITSGTVSMLKSLSTI